MMYNASVLITGCSSGLGISLCHKILECKFFVIACCKNIQESYNNLSSRRTGIALVLDVTSDESIEEVLTKFQRDVKNNTIPKLYAVINNAAIWRFTSFTESSTNKKLRLGELNRWKSVLETNVIGAVRVTLGFLTLLHPYNGCNPRVIFISSVLDSIALPGQCSYVSSKHAIKGFHESLLHELKASNIHSIIISLGPLRDTNLFNDLDNEGDGFTHIETLKLKNSLGLLRKLGSCSMNVASNIADILKLKNPKSEYRNMPGTFSFRIAGYIPQFLYINIVHYILHNAHAVHELISLLYKKIKSAVCI